jgi:predicted amidohydrolase YtcJ
MRGHIPIIFNSSKGTVIILSSGFSTDILSWSIRMADERMLPIRLYVMGHVDSNEYWGHQIPRLQDYGGGRLTVRSVKLIADGALGSWGAAMIQPYMDNPTSRGLLLTPPEILSSLIHQFVRDEWQVVRYLSMSQEVLLI